ncbi:MAG: PLP-dependent aminotransferase family protein [bacterium]|nr:PLP-dependent aminotransferase family protein [bacterium]
MASRSTKSPLQSIIMDRAARKSLQTQVFDQVRGAILSGQLSPGTRLPATRILASDLHVSRNTILGAFERLHAEGYIEGLAGSGTRVSNILPEELLLARNRSRVPSGDAVPAGKLSRLSQISTLNNPQNRHRPGPARAFRPGLPDLSQFPFQLWGQLVAKSWRNPPTDTLLAGEMEGYFPLRQSISDYLGAVRGLHCAPEQVLITSGAQQALDLIARVIIDPGDKVWLEDPGYHGLRSTLQAAGAKIYDIRVDEEGICVKRGRKQAPDSVLAAITPSHQYPLGTTMSLTRRLELLDWAKTSNAWILEDDYDSEFRYAGKPHLALQGLDQSQRVIYVGTFSKVLFPALRLGYMVVPAPLLTSFTAVRASIDDYPALALQPALHRFIDDGHFASHIRKLRKLYSKRQQTMINALQQHAAGCLIASPTQAGMHLVVRLNRACGFDDKQISDRAAKAGLIAPALSRFYKGKHSSQGLVLGYAGLSEQEVNLGVKHLAQLL